MSEQYKAFNALAMAIIGQGIKDYLRLKKAGVEEIVCDDRATVSKREVEKFFRSEWCDVLLNDMKLTGEDILRYLDR